MDLKQNITFETFLSLDIRVCEIIEASRIPKTDKLLKLLINTGVDERECITNLGEHFEPEVFIGKKLPFILNLEPTVIKKVESRAMVFIAEKDGMFEVCNNFNTGDKIYI